MKLFAFSLAVKKTILKIYLVNMQQQQQQHQTRSL